MDTSVTVQTIIDNSIARTKDPAAAQTQWKDAVLLNLLNKGLDFVHKILIRLQSELAITESTVTMVAATQEYVLSGNLDNFWAMAPHGVYFSGTGEFLTPITHEDKVRSGTDDTDTYPGGYYLTATHIGVVDIPSAVSVNLHPTLSCRYFAKNAPLILTDPMPYKNVFNDAVGAFMDHMAVLKVGDDSTAEFTALYNALEESAIDIASKRTPL